MSARIANGKVRLRNGKLALVSVGLGSSPPPSGNGGTGQAMLPNSSALTANEVGTDQFVFQRIGTSKDITVSGTYTGTAPTALEARLIDYTAGTSVSVWAALKNAAIGGGTFTGTLTAPQGGWYKLEVRDTAAPTVSAKSARKFGVGMAILFGGQSNMVNSWSTSWWYPLGSDKAVEYVPADGTVRRVGKINDSYPPNRRGDNISTTSVGNTGDELVYLLNFISLQNNVPVMAIEGALIGSNIDTSYPGATGGWLTGQSRWTTVSQWIAAVGGDFELVLWHQGESDASLMDTPTMVSKLQQFYTQCQTFAKRDSTSMKFGVVSLGPGNYNGSTPGQFGNMRAAHLQFARTTPGAFLLGCAHDAATVDGVHIEKVSFGRIGPRLGQAVASFYAGNINCGPRITSASFAGNKVVVKVAHTGGTALQDGNGGTGTALTGFEIKDSTNTVIPYTSAITAADTIELTLTASRTGACTLSYAMMDRPHNTTYDVFVPASCPYDNAPVLNGVGMVLQPCAAISVG